MRRAILIVFLAGLAAAVALPQEPDEPLTADTLVEATARAAAIFARSAPGIVARERLEQRGRRGFVQVLEQQAKKQDGNVTVKLPPQFRTHVVISDYAFAQIGKTHAIHEIRSILTIDGRTISPADEARHALAIGVQSEDDELKHHCSRISSVTASKARSPISASSFSSSPPPRARTTPSQWATNDASTACR